MLLSICIPNYNRSVLLANCLESIYQSKLNAVIDFEVCISDNSSTDKVDQIVESYKKKLKIKFNVNKKNIGVGANILKSVSMASGEFVWIIGSDDLILPKTLSKISKLIKLDKDIDFFFINSFEVYSNEILDEDKKFNLKKIPLNCKKRSNLIKIKKLKFFDLIDPNISWDFLLGLYLSIFRREKWKKHSNIIDQDLIMRPGTFSTFENTCPHIKIFARAFAKSDAYFENEPLTISMIGEREWSSLYNFIEIIRIPEILDHFRSNGLTFKKYFICKNYSIRNFISYSLKIIFYKGNTGLRYIKLKKHFFNNLIFPNLYLSFLRFILSIPSKLIPKKKY